jgi:hypothetical protein
MTVERRTLIELADITGIEFECPNCKTKVFYPLKKEPYRLPQNCPNCNETWLVLDQNQPSGQHAGGAILELLTNLRRAVESPFVKAHVRLHITPEEAV